MLSPCPRDLGEFSPSGHMGQSYSVSCRGARSGIWWCPLQGQLEEVGVLVAVVAGESADLVGALAPGHSVPFVGPGSGRHVHMLELCIYYHILGQYRTEKRAPSPGLLRGWGGQAAGLGPSLRMAAPGTGPLSVQNKE